MADKTRTKCGRKPDRGKDMLRLSFITPDVIRSYQYGFGPLIRKNHCLEHFCDGVLFGNAFLFEPLHLKR